jgi:hypothetical protein
MCLAKALVSSPIPATLASSKFEARNPKLETMTKIQIAKFKTAAWKRNLTSPSAVSRQRCSSSPVIR